MRKDKEEWMTTHLGFNEFFKSLTGPGSVYEGYPEDTSVNVAAVEGSYGDWATYFGTPDTPPGREDDLGAKLPEEVAGELFPELAKRLKYRQ